MSFSIIPPQIKTSLYKTLKPSSMNRNRNPSAVNVIGINGNNSGSDSDDFEIIENAHLIHSVSTSAQNAFNNNNTSNNAAGPSSGPTWKNPDTTSNINKLFNPYIPKSSHFGTNVPNGIYQDDQEQTKEDEEFIKRAKESLRSFQCRYKINSIAATTTSSTNASTVCNAILGNYNALHKHVTMHLRKQFADMHEESDDNNVFSAQAQRRYTCQWGNCRHDDIDIHRLKQHIEFDHLESELRCPFIGCNEKMFRAGYGVSNLTIHTQDIRKHPPPWSETSIRPNMLSKNRPVKPPPIDPNFSLPPFLISTPPILPRGKSRSPTPRSSPKSSIPTLASLFKPIPSIPRHIRDEQQTPPQVSASSSRYSRSTSPTFRQMEENILPNRDECEIPFFPICGEAISYDSTGTFSGSIFPSTVRHEEGDDESREKDKFGQLIIPTSSEWVEDGYRPLTVRKKSVSINGKSKLGRPRLGVPADVFEYKRKQKELWDKKQKKLLLRIRPQLMDRKGKGKEVPDNNDDNSGNGNGNGVDLGKRLIKFDLEKIRISALRYATRRTTKSIGKETWNEVIRFENEGRYWDEL